MGLSMRSRQELAVAVAIRYRSAARAEKSLILNGFVADTGYTRAYGALVLRNSGRRLVYTIDESNIEAVASPRVRGGGGRPRVYHEEVRQVVEQLWELYGYLCGKRLVPVIYSSLPFLNEEEFLQVSESAKQALSHISAATVDRLLTVRRQTMRLKGNSYTRGTAALSEQIPIRTFGEWDNVGPGHVQVDLVGHDGGRPTGQCCFTLTATDVCLGWTERRAVLNRAARWVKAALEEIREDIPFPLIELHPDNGSEFINHNLFQYCRDTHLSMSRSRAGRKNDNCYVEQKNFDTVRKLVGYARFATPEAVQALNELYRTQAQLQNFIYPSQKLLTKERHGSKVVKHYDRPQSPAQRLLARKDIDEEVKEAVRQRLQSLNPLHLARQVAMLQDTVASLAERQRAESINTEEHTA